jgi:hypothetical protein
MGSKMRNTVRTKDNVVGASTTFQTLSKGAAVTKARHAEVATMNLDHAPVLCTLADYYAADYIDKLDEIKTNIAERMIVAQSAAAAVGRKTDDLIQTALLTSTNLVSEGGTALLTQTKINTVFSYFGKNDVPDDGERYWALGVPQWTDLLAITAFASSDYVGQDQLPYKMGMSAKRWMTFMWYTWSGFVAATNIWTTLAYHKTAVGSASGMEVQSEMNYIPERVATLATSMMSQGACLIDNIGSYKVQAYNTL